LQNKKFWQYSLLGEKHYEALVYIKLGVEEDKGILVLTGEENVEKKVLLNCLPQVVYCDNFPLTFQGRGASQDDLFKFLAETFRLSDISGSKTDFLVLFRARTWRYSNFSTFWPMRSEIEDSFAKPEEFVHIFKSLLLRAYVSYKKVLIIIDVPQRLNSTLLSEISVLAKIKMAGRRLLKIFFVWQLEFNQIMVADDNKGMLEEVAAAERLEPPSETDIEAYINHRLAVAGCKREVFTPETSESIYRHTLGLASAVNALCDNSIVASFLSKTSYINTDIIERCSRKIQMPFQ
jgi:general secretion pathway protein A